MKKKKETITQNKGACSLVDRNIPKCIDIGIEHLPELHRTMLAYRIYAKKSYKEIAEMIGYTEGYVRVSVYRSKKKLRQLDSLLKHRDPEKETIEEVVIKWKYGNFEI